MSQIYENPQLYIWYSDLYKINFVHIPKTAGSTIKYFLEIDQHHFETLQSYKKEYPILIFVRDPQARWASSYRYVSNNLGMNFGNYSNFVNAFRSVGPDLNVHLTPQWCYLRKYNFEYTLLTEDINLILPEKIEKNRSQPVNEVLTMPDDIREKYYEKDFEIYNKLKASKRPLNELREYLRV